MTGLYGTDSDDEDPGHGWVVPRADGLRAMCGGPSRCPLCAAALARQAAERDAVEARRQARQIMRREHVDHGLHVVLGTPRGVPSAGMCWYGRCDCGWRSTLHPHTLGMDSEAAREQIRGEFDTHRLSATIDDAAERALAEWTITHGGGQR